LRVNVTKGFKQGLSIHTLYPLQVFLHPQPGDSPSAVRYLLISTKHIAYAILTPAAVA